MLLRGQASSCVLAALLASAAADTVYHNSAAYHSGALGGDVLQSFHSSSLTPPALNIKTPYEGTSGVHNLTFLAYRNGGPPVIFDSSGSLVWSGQDEHIAMGLDVQYLFGEPVLTFYTGPVFLPRGYGRGHHTVLAQNYSVIRTITGANLPPDSVDIHELVITPENTALLESYVTRAADLSSIGGPKEGWILDTIIQEIDLANDDALLFEWRTADHIPVNETAFSLQSGAHGRGTKDDPFDFAHINSLHKDARGNYLFSLRGLCSLYSVDGKSGEVIWRLGGRSSSFELGEGARFFYQHAARFRSDITTGRYNVSLFDNGAFTTGNDEEPTARGLVLTLDEEKWTATVTAEYLPSHGTTSPSQGNVDSVGDDGSVLVGWGSEPYFSQYDQGGKLVYDVELASKAGGSDAQSYRAHRSAWHGRPTTLPSLSLNTTTGKAYVSWNGATEVGKWVLLGGDNKSQLRPLGEVRKTGFETQLPLHSSVKYFAVAAAPKHGRKYLATSLVYHTANATAAGVDPAIVEQDQQLVLQRRPNRLS